IGTRLMAGFGSVLAIMLATLVASTVLDQSARTTLAGALESARAKESTAAQLRSLSLEQSALMRNIALHSEVKGMQDDEARARTVGARYDELVARLVKQDLSAAERAIVDELVRIDQAIDKPLVD